MGFIDDLREEIESLSQASVVLRQHSENLRDLIYDLRHIVFLTMGSNIDDATKEFDTEFETLVPFLLKFSDVLNEYAVALDYERWKLMEELQRPPESPPHICGDWPDY